MKVYYVNTNKSNCKKCYEMMLNQNRVISWYNTQLQNIKKGDLILLYHNDKGFIGVGFAITKMKDSYECENEHFVEVKWILKTFDNPIQANNIDFKGMFNKTAQVCSINFEKLFEEISKRIKD